MVVDDNVDAAEMLKLLLEASGHRVLIAHSAQDALALVPQTPPAILFLDIGLPDMDGYQLARHLRALPETASSLLVAVTGYGQPEDRSLALGAGFDHHLVKPVQLSAVLALLETVAKQGAGAPTPSSSGPISAATVGGATSTTGAAPCPLRSPAG